MGRTSPAAPETGGIATRGLPARGRRRLAVLVGRALRRRCPYCGGRGIFAGWFTLRDRCPTCGVVLEREEGYFLGAYAVNLIVAEFLAVGLVVALMVFGDLSTLAIQLIGVAAAIGLPLLFYPFSRTLWMALDLQVDPPERQRERRLRGHEMGR